MVQIVLGALFLFFLVFGTRLGKFTLAVAVLMLLIVIGERVAIGLGMENGGTRDRSQPGTPRTEAIVARNVMNYGYKMAEWLKFTLGALAAITLIWHQSRPSLDSRKQVDLIDKTDYRHINR